MTGHAPHLPIIVFTLAAFILNSCSMAVAGAGQPAVSSLIPVSHEPAPATLTPTRATNTHTTGATASPEASSTPTRTLEPTATPTFTPTPTPTSLLYAILQPPEGSSVGGYLYNTPQGTRLDFIRVGTAVILLGEQTEISGQNWVRVRVPSLAGKEGWVPERSVVSIPLTPGCTANVEETFQALNGVSLNLIRNNPVPTLNLFLVSSGVFGAVDVDFGDGRTAVLDVVWAYAKPKGRLAVFPITIGVRLPEGDYFLLGDPHRDDRWVDLHDAQNKLERGRIFSASITGFVTSNNVLWKQCDPEVYGDHPEICQIGQVMDEQFPGVVSNLLKGWQPREGWVLFGWTLDEFDPDHNLIWEIELPTCSGG